MKRRPLAFVLALTLATVTLVAGARGASPAPEQPPAGAVLILVAQSDGLAWLPVGRGIVPPIACQP